MTDDRAFRERHYTSQDGLRLYYREYGDPMSPTMPVLCLAGLTRNSADFHDLAMRLAPQRWVLCPDYRGRGRSDYDPDWRNYIGGTYVNDTRHLMIAAGLHRAVVVGTSMGGLLAMGMGAAIPTALAGVILNDVGPEVERDGIERILGYIGEDRPQPDWKTAINKLRKEFPQLGFKTDDAWQGFAEATYREGKDGRLHYDWDVNIAKPLLKPTAPEPDLWQLFHALCHIPLLAIRGTLSDVLSPETLERMHELHPTMTSVTVPDVGHVPSLDEPEAKQAIDEFLSNT